MRLASSACCAISAKMFAMRAMLLRAASTSSLATGSAASAPFPPVWIPAFAGMTRSFGGMTFLCWPLLWPFFRPMGMALVLTIGSGEFFLECEEADGGFYAVYGVFAVAVGAHFVGELTGDGCAADHDADLVAESDVFEV